MSLSPCRTEIKGGNVRKKKRKSTTLKLGLLSIWWLSSCYVHLHIHSNNNKLNRVSLRPARLLHTVPATSHWNLSFQNQEVLQEFLSYSVLLKGTISDIHGVNLQQVERFVPFPPPTDCHCSPHWQCRSYATISDIKQQWIWHVILAVGNYTELGKEVTSRQGCCPWFPSHALPSYLSLAHTHTHRTLWRCLWLHMQAPFTVMMWWCRSCWKFQHLRIIGARLVVRRSPLFGALNRFYRSHTRTHTHTKTS